MNAINQALWRDNMTTIESGNFITMTDKITTIKFLYQHEFLTFKIKFSFNQQTGRQISYQALNPQRGDFQSPLVVDFMNFDKQQRKGSIELSKLDEKHLQLQYQLEDLGDNYKLMTYQFLLGQ